MDDLAKRIAAWRELRGLSQHQLADAVGVTAAAVYQWEGGNGHIAVPSTANLVKVAKALGITMSKFWGPLPAKKAS